LATAAAPTYFAQASVRGPVADTEVIDGGVWANDPALVAMVEAVRWLSVPIDRIEVLSIGTTSSPFSAVRQRRAGLLGWGTKAIDLLMSAQSDGAHRLAEALAHEVRMLRIDQLLPAGMASLDDVRTIGQLAQLGQQVASDPKFLAPVKERFLNGVEVENWRTTVPRLPASP